MVGPSVGKSNPCLDAMFVTFLKHVSVFQFEWVFIDAERINLRLQLFSRLIDKDKTIMVLAELLGERLKLVDVLSFLWITEVHVYKSMFVYQVLELLHTLDVVRTSIPNSLGPH